MRQYRAFGLFGLFVVHLGCSAATDHGSPPSGDRGEVAVASETGAPPEDDTSVANEDTGTIAPEEDGATPASETSAPIETGAADVTPPPSGLAKLGSLVFLGDSISDGGGQAPFYYDLLRTDLEKKYGSLQVQRRAESGSKTSDLSGQIKGLPSKLPGPVAVCITSGGNDMKAVWPSVALGTDGPARATMRANVKKALDELLAPNRFGAGVEVKVYEGNIYDASDGKGDFSSHDCKFAPKGVPAMPSDKYFGAWNGEISAELIAHGQTVADMHAHFFGHGYSGSPSWYASDCTHPNAGGHSELRRLFYKKITGETIP